jgi:hypothetical protein
MYNVLEKLRAGEPLTAKDKTIHAQGLISLLAELHDDLDRAVFAAYGWDDLAERLIGRPGATTPLPDQPDAQTEAEETPAATSGRTQRRTRRRGSTRPDPLAASRLSAPRRRAHPRANRRATGDGNRPRIGHRDAGHHRPRQAQKAPLAEGHA